LSSQKAIPKFKFSFCILKVCYWVLVQRREQPRRMNNQKDLKGKRRKRLLKNIVWVLKYHQRFITLCFLSGRPLSFKEQSPD
jgi:hypothetical protein